MSESTFTQTGVNELRRGIDQLPDAVTTAARGVAKETADRIHAREKQLLAQQTHGEGNTAAALKVTEDAANKKFDVHFGRIKGRPANLPIFLEYGTIHMAARPFVRPAADAERQRYASDLAAAVETAARSVLKD